MENLPNISDHKVSDFEEVTILTFLFQ